MQIQKSEQIRKFGLKLFDQHLKNVYGNNNQQENSQANQLINHIDTLLQIFSHLITHDFHTQTNSITNPTSQSYPHLHCQQSILSLLIETSIAQDIRYSYIMYKSKSQQTSHASQTQASSAIRYFKYLQQIHCYVRWILQGSKGKGFNQSMFQDFVLFMRSGMNVYEKSKYGHGHGLGLGVQEMGEMGMLDGVYGRVVGLVVQECCKLGLDNQVMRKRVYKVIQNTISITTLTQTDTKTQISPYLKILLTKTPSILLQITQLPPLLLLHIHHSQLPILLSPTQQAYLNYLLIYKLCPSSTLESRAGGVDDVVLACIQDVVKNMCQILQRVEQFGIVVQGQKIYIDAQNYIDLVQLYRRMSIYSGFLSPQYSKQCHQQITQTLTLNHPRYTPALKLKIWSHFLHTTQPTQLNYRIFCITQYRKIMSSSSLKPSLNTIADYTLMIIKTASLLIGQLQSIQVSKQFDYNYVGHVVSFVMNWVNGVRVMKRNVGLSEGKYERGVVRVQQLWNVIKGLLKQIQQKLSQNLQVEIVKDQQLQKQVSQGNLTIQDKNKRSKTVDIELLLFRFKDIVFPV